MALGGMAEVAETTSFDLTFNIHYCRFIMYINTYIRNTSMRLAILLH